MSKFTRRDVVKLGAGAALAGALGGRGIPAAAQEMKLKPEPGAKLRVLRWKQFVQGDIEAFTANTKKFTQQTGIEVRLDTESWEDVRPKAAVAAHRPRRLSRQEIRRLVRRLPRLRHAQQEMDSAAAGDQRVLRQLSDQPRPKGRLREDTDRPPEFSQALSKSEEERHAGRFCAWPCHG